MVYMELNENVFINFNHLLKLMFSYSYTSYTLYSTFILLCGIWNTIIYNLSVSKIFLILHACENCQLYSLSILELSIFTSISNYL